MEMTLLYFRAGFLNLCSAEHWCSAAPFLVFRRIIKKLKNRLAQMKDLCEQDFSSMLYVKNKYTSQMKDLDNRLRLKLTKIEPDFAKLCSSLQSQPSH